MTLKHFVLLAMFVLCACATPPPIREAGPGELEPGSLKETTGPEIWAYHAYWMGDTWRSFDLASFGRLLFMDLPVGMDGRIEDTRGWPDQWSALREGARKASVQLDPAFTVLTPEVFAAVFASPAARSRLLDEITFHARFSRGIHLDVEVYNPPPSAALEGYRAFLAELRKRLDASPRKILTAFVPASNLLYGEKELRFLDAVVAQGYDVHWQKSVTAGPPALLDGDSPASWRSAAALLEKSGVPPRKILFSTPFYGYEWPTISDEARSRTRAQGDIITYAPVPASILPDIRNSALARVREHGLRRETATGTPWYAFRERGGWRQGWYDDAVSLAPRLDFVQRGDYRGVAVFVLGYDNGELLEVIRAAFRARTAPAPSGGPPAAR